jgi:hypothetical protein
MSETYARGGGQEQATSGGILIVAISLLSTILVIGALIYAAGTGERHTAALQAAGCEPNLSPSGLQCTTAEMLFNQYMSTITPDVQQLNTDVAAYTANEKRNLAAAQAALTAEVASERAFDASVGAIQFPPNIAPIAKALLQANQARAELTAEQARSSSLTQLRSFNRRVKADATAVQAEMSLIHKALDAPPVAG